MKSSANQSLFTVASDTTGLDLGGSDPTHDTFDAGIAAKENKVYSAGNKVIQSAKFTGGRITTAPQISTYVNARTSEGAKVYKDPEASYMAAVENFASEASMAVNPTTGTRSLTISRVTGYASADSFDVALLPSYNGSNTGIVSTDNIGTPTFDLFSGAGKILQCPSLAYVGASAAACGGTFVSPPTQGKVCTNLANPSVSKTTSTSNFVTYTDDYFFHG